MAHSEDETGRPRCNMGWRNLAHRYRLFVNHARTPLKRLPARCRRQSRKALQDLSQDQIGASVLVERVRNTDVGHRDKWRKP